ncbi:translation machinery-associated protein 16-like [Lineus longissimus]|uniref:translation machinery-associated protein 16-like n=1 Tax=Lineus longissimus TaxID=88925 RepID=UPI002B4D9342
MPKAPKIKLGAQGKKAMHPNSRKAQQFSRQQHHELRVQKRMTEKGQKMNAQGEKLLWFQEQLDPAVDLYTLSEVGELIERYLHRFDEEVEQIEIKNSIGNRKNRQNASREDVIKHTIETERRDYNAGGIELPDLTRQNHLKTFREWTGEMRFVQNFKFRRITSQMVEKAAEKEEEMPLEDEEVKEGLEDYSDHEKDTENEKTDDT